MPTNLAALLIVVTGIRSDIFWNFDFGDLEIVLLVV
jgi:hypothetical protein